MLHSRRPIVVMGLLVVALTGVVGVSQWRAAHVRDIIPWRSNLAAAQVEAKAQHKRVFAYFTAAWCGPCQQLRTTTWADNAVRQAIERRFVPVEIDVDQQRETARAYGVESMPSFVVLGDTGEPIRRQSGYMDEKEMVDWLERTQ